MVHQFRYLSGVVRVVATVVKEWDIKVAAIVATGTEDVQPMTIGVLYRYKSVATRMGAV